MCVIYIVEQNAQVSSHLYSPQTFFYTYIEKPIIQNPQQSLKGMRVSLLGFDVIAAAL